MLGFSRARMAGVAGLEPVTSAVTGQRSNQLSYTPATGRNRSSTGTFAWVNPFLGFFHARRAN